MRTAEPAPGIEDLSSALPAGTDGLLELMPVPAAVLEIEGGRYSFAAVNTQFRVAGLGGTAQESPVIQLLGARIAQFFASDLRQEEIAWRFGGEVDSRHFRVVLARRDSREPRCLITLVDQTSELRTEQSLRREMATDSLTGLPNRAGFSDELEVCVGKGGAAAHAVLVLNLDRFSRVNACMGALAGDELLISVARRIKGALRGRDVLARIGGDEFGVLMTLDDGADDAVQVAKRVHAAFTNPFRLSNFEIRIDCSIGIALGSVCI